MGKASDNLFRTQVQIAIQGSITTDTQPTALIGDIILWHNRSRKHILYCEDTGDLSPTITSALLTSEVAKWSEYVPVFDPLILLDRFNNLDPSSICLVYIYDLDILGQLPEKDVVKFFSYMKYALMNNIRFILSMDCEFTLPSLDHYFKNKKVASMVMFNLINDSYCHKVGL